ncbi:uncharacterized protein PV06_02851 [Exophiala oligosperma]|uniref:Amine oxidase n=1 Tax=Exophiala oligosperma TaxID=215243 RepID=A0A0D2DVZ7_9EURO|nr:uncharacterized protein PV06_02851 [Exophiala oligosperma]KIW47268.1 hypothetical protein PV06_02851 [Exophiala oligosperma]
MAPRDLRPSVEFVNTPGHEASPLYHDSATVTAAGRLVFTSGVVGVKDGRIVKELKPQVKQAFENLASTLAASGSRPVDILHLRFYVVNWHWTETEHLVKEWMDLVGHKPPTCLVPVPKLYQEGVFFEVEAVAATGGCQKVWSNPGPSILGLQAAPTKTDVVVVGGGFSGVQAAYDLHKSGLRVILLEATHRIGGRSKTIKLASGPGYTELGATWINKTTQPKIYAHAQRLGLTFIEQYNPPEAFGVFQKTNGVVARAKVSDPAYSGPEFSAEETKSFNKFLEAFQWELTENPNIDINNTSSFPNAEDLSVAEWAKKRQLGHTGEQAAAALCRANVGREPDEVGIHYWADYVKSGGGLYSLISDDELGAQNLFIKEGTSAIAQGLAAELKPGSVLVNSAVDEINQHGDQVLLTTVNGSRFLANKVIMANPTNTYTKIKFTPPLPQGKRTLVTQTRPGIYAKACITYAKPWWRELGLLGKFRSYQGPICFSWELSVFDLNSYTLALFIAGKAAEEWYKLTPLAREQAVLEHLSKFVEPEQRHLVDNVLEFNMGTWSEEEWMGGAPTSAMPPGYLSRFGEELRAPWKNIHFAGGETAREWKGYLEGALRAGSRAADEVISIMGSKGHL